MKNTALQVTNFDFYGDSLIAIQDNATGEIYTAITHILRGIGFNEKQVEHQQKKILTDEVLKLHTQKFSGVNLHMPSINEIWCISNRKLPLALAKINITPKMKHEQPELSEKLLKYQDKCADVLASVFIDNKQFDTINLQPLIDTLSSITDRLVKLEEIQIKKETPEKKYSRWKTRTFKKLNALLSYVNENSDETLKLSEVIHLIITETEDIYNIEINDYVDAYKSEYGLENTPYVIDVINYYKDVRDMFTLTLDSIMEKLHLSDKKSKQEENIFDLLVSQVENNT